MAEPAAAADAAKKAALIGEFGKVFNGCSLRTPVQQKLVAYFAGRGGGHGLLFDRATAR